MTDAVKKIEELAKKALQRSKEQREQGKSKSEGSVVTLPIWPASTRGTPNAFLRGALFSAIQGKERRALTGELLASQKGLTIRYTGITLDQCDLDVWEAAVQIAHGHPLGNVCQFQINGFLKLLGRKNSGTEHAWLKDSLRRLMAAGVEISDGHYSYGGSMLEWWHDIDNDTYQLKLNPRILALYKAGWTQIEWKIRQDLKRKPLALWVHGWLSSNTENFPTKLETVRKLSGSINKQKAGFKRHLQKALTDLVAVGAINDFKVEDDLVHILREPTRAQRRHIAKTSKKPV